MIKIIEKEALDDNFIIKALASNISLHDRICFSKKNIYYFGNYKAEYLNKIKDKLLKNKKSIIKAIESGVKFIICGNSNELFNNQFNRNNLNLYTCFDSSMFKKRLKKLEIKKRKKSDELINVYDLKKSIPSTNFKYKNLLCINNEDDFNKIIKKLF